MTFWEYMQFRFYEAALEIAIMVFIFVVAFAYNVASSLIKRRRNTRRNRNGT